MYIYDNSNQYIKYYYYMYYNLNSTNLYKVNIRYRDR